MIYGKRGWKAKSLLYHIMDLGDGGRADMEFGVAVYLISCTSKIERRHVDTMRTSITITWLKRHHIFLILTFDV